MNGDFFGLILSAGKGTRMRPFSPKEMLPFVNKSIIVHSIDSLKSLGVTNVNIVVGEGKYNIEEHVGNGAVFDVCVSYDFQQLLDGDAGGINCANTTKYSSAKYVIILFGDTVFSDVNDLIGLKEQFLRFKDDPLYVGAIAFKKYPSVIPAGSSKFPYGVGLIRDEFITRIHEKPDASLLSDFSVDGYTESIATAYIFKKDDLFRMIADLYSAGSSGEFHLSDAVKLWLSSGKKFSGFSIAGKALDMGRPLPYLTALREWFLSASDSDVTKAASDWEALASKFRNGY
ncbi:MAG TPA: sugar phosphate nucleotidyltransferase [Candidatus Nanoarchaeia archaeon]|nr:sugar phosphate nucleotidyltransferase [Candidatus Nanoarchaeia archaeon]